MYRRVWGLLVIFVLFSFLACTGCGKDSGQNEIVKPTVAVAVAKMEPLIMEKNYEAILKLDEEQFITAETSGYIRHFFFSEGSQVKAGDKLALLDNATIYATGERRDHELELAQIQYDKMQIQAEEAKNRINRRQVLYENGAISKVELDQSLMDWQLAQKNLQEAQKGLKLAEVSQRESQLNEENCIVKATDSLWIVEELVQLGQFINTGQAILKAGKMDYLIMTIDVHRDEIKAWEVGDAIDVTCQGEVKTAKIININPLSHPGGQAASVKLKINNSSLDWFPGAVAQAKFTKDMGEQVLIPVLALAKGQEPYVYLVKDGKVYRQPITLGEVVGNKVSVFGLESGSLLVTEGLHRLRDGEAVEIKEGF